MPDNSPSILILTCGAGTAGRHSNLTEGLIRSVHLTEPRALLVVCTRNDDSQAIADLVREVFRTIDLTGATGKEAPIIGDPDDLFDCRDVIRQALRTAREALRGGERLIINPTSGTKQMSVGATLAALEEGIGEIVFTVGDRTDGVVRTGSERLATFHTRRFLHERTLTQAEALFQAGACLGASRLLQPFRDLDPTTSELALSLHHWQSLHYDEARRLAAASDAPALAPLRKYLTELTQEDPPGERRVADLFASADRLLAWGATGEALIRYYLPWELPLRAILARDHHLNAPFQAEAILSIPSLPKRASQRFKSNARGETLNLTLKDLFDVVDALAPSLAAHYFKDPDFRNLLSRRNELVHETTAPAGPEVERLRQKTLAFLEATFEGITGRLPTGRWPANLSQSILQVGRPNPSDPPPRRPGP